jgi:hypothetical protein
MTIKEAYIYMLKVLEVYWEKTHNDELGSLLGQLNPFLFRDEKPADPAAWDDWLKAVREITYGNILTKEQMLKAMVLLLEEYNDYQGFDLVDVIEDLRKLYRIEV